MNDPLTISILLVSITLTAGYYRYYIPTPLPLPDKNNMENELLDLELKRIKNEGKRLDNQAQADSNERFVMETIHKKNILSIDLINAEINTTRSMLALSKERLSLIRELGLDLSSSADIELLMKLVHVLGGDVPEGLMEEVRCMVRRVKKEKVHVERMTM